MSVTGCLATFGHICRASRVGAEIWLEKLPISSAAKEMAHAAGQDVSKWALAGGEDYELLFTALPESAAEIQGIVTERTGTGCHVIGRVVDEAEGIQLRLENGKKIVMPEGFTGWDHFAGEKFKTRSRFPHDGRMKAFRSLMSRGATRRE